MIDRCEGLEGVGELTEAGSVRRLKTRVSVGSRGEDEALAGFNNEIADVVAGRAGVVRK